MTTRRWIVPLFCFKFLVYVTVLVILWWHLLPFYGQFLLQTTGLSLKHLMRMPIESGSIEVKGLLNTDTILTFVIDGRQRGMPIALLVTNLPPYVALVLATAGLAFRKRLLILFYGCGILCFFHIMFIILALRFQDAMMRVSEIPTAVVQFFLTLPFMLWIVFAYWDRIVALAQDTPEKSKATPPTEDEAGEE